MRSGRIIGTLLLAGGIGAIAFQDEIPRWRRGGADVVVHAPLVPVGTFPVRLASGKAIVILGDSNVSGSRVGGRDKAFPALLDAPDKVGAQVINLGRGAATAPSANTWNHRSKPQLVIIMFGTNDAAPRRMLARKEPVPPSLYAARLTSLVETAFSRGAQVLILAAPPAGSAAMDRRIAPYRTAARKVAVQTGVHFRDPMEAFSSASSKSWGSSADLQRDGLHLGTDGQLRLARWLDQLLAAT